ncbi:MAG: 50S ribosomal protein L6 [Hyphomicrobium sp.]|uniref:50S ribosomal protein L6 n=1 Tax=Hyphomicrobium sp. TaxID=82 RepID=UPI001327E6EE|nr:50S ribosomal protein L6 [Hyphomicrobium sp.]KAB2942870.1 MAG: 50S ribosomal protein L6 [Hyphomicrobium sp.]MBZ0211864.1 50S ribosomal protein L6 [Hyphomicrobium sp.]MCZ7596370.1 50S ribosomal protein L6 [Hyphomicrobium sp.]
MSRIGKRAVPVPSNVTATVSGREVKVKGPKGELSFTVPDKIKVEKSAEGIEVTPLDETKMARSMWGMSRTMISNLMGGVTNGYSRTLEIQGIGFRAAMKGKDQLQLNIGFSHDVVHKIPAGVEVKVSGAKQEIITVSGIDRQLVGQVAANIRASRPPEPYQGKGIRYQGEYIFRKEGKKK